MNISVLVPTYRRVDDLKRCLAALSAQAVPPCETIVVAREEDVDTRAFLASVRSPRLSLKVALVGVPGVVAAMNKGLELATGDVVAITDDDAAPPPRWLEQIAAAFAREGAIGGVGGRDRIVQDGVPLEGEARAVVGRIQWFGRMVGNHHVGAGAPRPVDFLKGVNCAYRTEPLRRIGFDDRLLGTGAQVHWEVSVGLAMKRQGWTLVYDPSIAVFHYPSARFDEDRRGEFRPEAVRNAVHNETLIVWEHLSGIGRAAYFVWMVLVGTRHAPGLLQLLRGAVRRREAPWRRYRAVVAGRRLGIRAARAQERAPIRHSEGAVR